MEKWTPKTDWLKFRLKDYKLTPDSDFYEYIGKAFELEDFLDVIRGSTEISYALYPQLEELFNMSRMITAIRYNYFKNSTKRDKSADLSQKVAYEYTYGDYVSLNDYFLQNQVDELYTSLCNKNTKDAEIIIPFVKKKLLQSLKIESYVYEQNIGPLKNTVKDFIKKYSYTPLKHVDFDSKSTYPNSKTIQVAQEPPKHTPNYNNTYTYYSTPTPIVPNEPYIQPQHTQFNSPYTHTNYAPSNQPKADYNNTIYTNPPAPPVQHTRRSIRNRKRHIGKKVFDCIKNPNLLIPISIGLVTMVLATTPVCKALPKEVHPPTPIETQVPSSFEQQAQFVIQDEKVIITPEVSSTIPPSTIQTQTYNINQNATETTPTYKKGTLMYNLQSMNDETITFIANSLRQSIKGLNEAEMRRFGNDCNLTFDNDREFVAHVFRLLDADYQYLNKSSLGYDPSIILPQVEQLTNDLTKHIIAKSLNESGLYSKTNYEMKDIDFYSTRMFRQSPEVSAVTIRTVSEDDGKLVEDQRIGNYTSTYSHLPKDLGRAIQIATTLTNIKNDVTLGYAGDVAAEYSKLAYHKLIILTEPGLYLNYDEEKSSTNLEITKLGKGMKLESSIDNSR